MFVFVCEDCKICERQWDALHCRALDWEVGMRIENDRNGGCAVGKGAGQRRRKAAITVGKDRRESVVRAKRLRRADGADEAMQLVTTGTGDEAAYKALEDSTVAAVHNLKNLYFPALQPILLFLLGLQFIRLFIRL